MDTAAGTINWNNVHYMTKDARRTRDYIALQKHVTTEGIYRMGKANKDSTTCVDEN